jgi:hypothetical protein
MRVVKAAITIQKVWRGSKERKAFTKIRKSVILAQAGKVISILRYVVFSDFFFKKISGQGLSVSETHYGSDARKRSSVYPKGLEIKVIKMCS